MGVAKWQKFPLILIPTEFVVSPFHICHQNKILKAMGIQYYGICKNCGRRFKIMDGGGFTFHMLRCDTCGKHKSVKFEQLGELHLRYLKGLNQPYSLATAHYDSLIKELFPGEPLPKDSYEAAIEEFVGKCKCGGQFRFKASPRCPRCRSTDFEEDPKGSALFYD